MVKSGLLSTTVTTSEAVELAETGWRYAIELQLDGTTSRIQVPLTQYRRTGLCRHCRIPDRPPESLRSSQFPDR